MFEPDEPARVHKRFESMLEEFVHQRLSELPRCCSPFDVRLGGAERRSKFARSRLEISNSARSIPPLHSGRQQPRHQLVSCALEATCRRSAPATDRPRSGLGAGGPERDHLRGSGPSIQSHARIVISAPGQEVVLNLRSESQATVRMRSVCWPEQLRRRSN